MATQDKYDRQTRLWGPHGQKALSESSIIMLGTSPAGTETLKNLVLPGCCQATSERPDAHFLVVDDKKVSKRDVGNNFFVSIDDIGKDIAPVVQGWLSEMNPDVRGKSMVSSVSNFIQNETEQIRNSSMVILLDENNETAAALSKICEPNNIPIILLRQYGMIGYMRQFKPECCVIEQKNDNSYVHHDVWVTKPFPELQAFCDNINLCPEMDKEVGNHIPWAVIQIKAVQKWRAENDGCLPGGKPGMTFGQKRPEKNAFMQLIHNMRPYGCHGQMNFIEEAMPLAVTTCYQEDKIPENIAAIYNNAKSDSHQALNGAFWEYCGALKTFVNAVGRMPVIGIIPDMHASPGIFIPLQKIYADKAQADRNMIWEILMNQMKQRGVAVEGSGVERTQFDTFCKCSRNFRVFNMSSIHQELEAPNCGDVQSAVYDPRDNWRWLVTVRAYEAARMTKPDIGVKVNDEADFAALQAEVAKQNQLLGVNQDQKKYSKEILRYGNARIHNIAAFMGGLAAQEACKLLMSQYIPLNNTFLFDGIMSHGQPYNM